MSYGKRIKEIRNNQGLTQAEFAKELGLKATKIKDIEIEKHKLTIEIAESIEQKYSIAGWWLLTGKGTKFNDAWGNYDLESLSLNKEDETKVNNLIKLLKHAPKDFIDNIIKRLEEFKKMSEI